jgi:choline dehydrogenase
VVDSERADYDVVIVGAGTAGCVVAARVSEERRRRVLLIEAGPYYGSLDNYPRELTAATAFGASEPGHPLNWSFTGMRGPRQRYALARGRVVGGTSALNGSAYLRATQDDCARWSAGGNDEWDEAGVMPYYIRSESDLAFGTQRGHGHAGPLRISRSEAGELTTTARALVDACNSHGFPALPDLNSSKSVGVGTVPSTERRGTRTNTAVAYLEPVVDRSNLTLLPNTTVSRVLVDRGRVRGVEAMRAGRLTTYRSAEVVLCAGAIKSPHLLMLSGIGPAEHLHAFGIAPVHDNAAIGANFIDHMKFAVRFRAQRQPPPPPEALFHEVALHYTGAGSSAEGDLQIIPPATPTLRAHSESDGAVDGGTLSFTCIQNAPWARGHIRLMSADPRVSPAIVYGSDCRDNTQTRDLARTAAALLRDDAFSALGMRPGEIAAKTLEDDRLLDDWIGGRLGIANHLCASARMGSPNDENSVVDAYGNVHGLQGLRVADLSIVNGVSRGPYATAVMVGEKIASCL